MECIESGFWSGRWRSGVRGRETSQRGRGSCGRPCSTAQGPDVRGRIQQRPQARYAMRQPCRRRRSPPHMDRTCRIPPAGRLRPCHWMNTLAGCEASSPSALVRGTGAGAGRVGLGLGLLTDRVADGGLLHRQQPRLLPVHSSPKPPREVTPMPPNSMPRVVRAPSTFACIPPSRSHRGRIASL